MKIQKHSDSTRSALSPNLTAESKISVPLTRENNPAVQPSRTVSTMLRCLFALVLSTVITSTNAEAVIYSVDRVVGPGTITGTIETNGAIGVLTSADIVDWNLTVDADGIPATTGQLLGPLSGSNSSIILLEGSPLTATANGLFFDFSLPVFAIFQITTPSSDVVWQLQAELFSDELIREPPFPPANQAFVTHPPVQQQIAIAAAVPMKGDFVIFGASHIGPEGDSTLHRIDPLSGAATAVGTGIGFQRVSGMDIDPATGILYATGEREAGDLDVNVLMTINVSTGVGTEIGPTGVVDFEGVFSGLPDFEGVFSDLSFRPKDQTLFGFSFPGQWVATIDLVTGEATQLAFESVIGDRGIEANSGNALAFVDSALIHAGSTGPNDPQAPSCAPDCFSALHEIDLTTDMATTLVALDFPVLEGFDNDFDIPRANGMDFHADSEKLFASIVYGFGGGGSTFLGMIQRSGDVTLIGETELGMDALAVISSVDIDIRPFSRKNKIRPQSRGVIPVAILGSEDFDALQINRSTVRFGPDGAKAIHWFVIAQDFNHDGFSDLMLLFNTRKTGIQCSDTESTLTGATYLNVPFVGTDSINTVGC